MNQKEVRIKGDMLEEKRKSERGRGKTSAGEREPSR